MSGKWLVPVLMAAMLGVSCSGNKSLLNESNPFDDPFFTDGLGNGTEALDEILREPAPNVGSLAREGAVQSAPRRASKEHGVVAGPDEEGVLLEAEGEGGQPAAGAQEAEDEEGALVASGQKSFYDQASEATMATMSVLVGAGMAALPFLIGT